MPAAEVANAGATDASYNVFPALLEAALVEVMREEKRRLHIVQIGSMDGESLEDPVFDFLNSFGEGCAALLVEPLPDQMERLKTNYGKCEAALDYETAAVHESDGETTIRRVTREAIEKNKLPVWVEGVSSIHEGRNAITGAGSGVTPEEWAAIEPHVTKETVQTITLKTLFSKHDWDTTDVLIVDAQGSDFDILSQLDFSNAGLRPSLILVDLGSMPGDDLDSIQKFLSGNGYMLCPMASSSDLLAIDTASLMLQAGWLQESGVFSQGSMDAETYQNFSSLFCKFGGDGSQPATPAA
mmetsp:Transcript_31954/g.38622  ORF Transcript_31954/g.38622 Transcript_31954/m.38622 type:complete len:298 (-) Transcript_31954:392-1285(-)